MNPRFGRLLTLAFVILLVLALPGAALAQTVLATVTTNSSGSFTTTVTIPSGTAPGFYDIAATGTVNVATPYPASTTPGISVSRTVVFAGESLTVTSSGWAPNTSVTLRLEFVSSAQASFSIAQTTETRTVRARIQVIAPGATIPPKTIIQNPVNQNFFIFNGLINPRDSGRSVIVNNNNSSSSSSSAAAAASGPAAAGTVATPTSVTRSLARTGIEALPLLAAGLATILLGSVLLSADRRRYGAQDTVSG